MGQTSANDDNANLAYPDLDARIAATYAAHSSATNKNSLYDSYLRAFRWASDRIGDRGAIALVANNGWVDGNTADGVRKSLAGEFSAIWVYNLRGNARTAGDVRQREGGGIFDSGARTGIAILIAVKNPDATGCRVRYYQVPDGLTREEKLASLDHATLATTPWQTITPNTHGDWINQRSETFETHPAIGAKDPAAEPLSYFALHSRGLATSRDAWAYNYSRESLLANMGRMANVYNRQVRLAGGDRELLDRNPTAISWSRGLEADALKGRTHPLRPERIYQALYRPFTRQWSYYDRAYNDMVYRLDRVFPTPDTPNVGILVIESGARAPFSVLATDCLPDSKMFVDAAQFFPRYTYLESSGTLLDDVGYQRVDNITDEIGALYRSRFGELSKDDIFAYVYAVLHSPQYREAFAADLKRMLPRIPLAATTADFWAFAQAGARLLDLHTNYESVEGYPLHERADENIPAPARYRVTKMRWADKTCKTRLIYNPHVTLGDIPASAQDYQLGSRSALDWIIDRYQVRTDKNSGIVNDPNDWGREHANPRYIVDLIAKVTRISIDTVTITRQLPELPI